jgi:hypothetical protein
VSTPPPIIAPAAYLAGAAQARALYTTLFEACLIAMPMNPAGEHNVECHYTARDLAAKLPGRSASVIQNELRWLENNSWLITSKGNMRFLGRRINGTFHLLADITAKQMTGEERFISSNILGVKLPGPPVTEKAAKRGAARRWDGPTTGGGGRLDLDPRAKA